MATPDTKYVLSLAQRIEDAKAILANLQLEWEGLFSHQADPIVVQEQSSPVRAGRKPEPDGPTAKIMNTVELEPQAIWDADLMSMRAGLTRKQTEKTLFNLASAKKIQRVGRGKYASNDFQPPEPPPSFALASVN